MSEVLIKVENVSKKFCKDLKRSLWYGMTDIARSVMGGAPAENLREGEFWAVRDVSFEVRRGECLGLIGHNGAGKSTLLKMLNGLINPDEGRIEMHGKIGALIELGAGFNPILTGRENVYNNGAVLGFSKAEIDRKFDDIVAFAEIEDFIDMPVQNYSSGMKVRLGFAIASQMEPDILIIDEVLAVGDVGFRIKCYNEIYKMMEKAAVIFVSHSMPQVAKICHRAILMSHSKLILNSFNIEDVINYYFNQFESGGIGIEGNGKAEIKNLEIINGKEHTKIDFSKKTQLNIISDNEFSIQFNFLVDVGIKDILILISIVDSEQKLIAQDSLEILDLKSANGFAKLIFNEALLNSGKYNILFHLFNYNEQNRSEILIGYRNFVEVIINRDRFIGPAPILLNSKWELNN